MTKSGYEVCMALCVALGSMFGLLPLIQRVVGWEQGGLYGKVTGGLGITGPWTYLLPLGVVVVMFSIVIVLDGEKKKRS